jgi:preprotein translocase subunit YajC
MLNKILLMAPPGGADGEQGGGMEFFILMGGMFLVMYLFFFRPQIKKQKETQKMIEALKKGDKVILQAGMHGSIVNIDDKTVLVQVDDNTKIRFEKSAIVGKK